jgi:hypothetical protein
MNDYISDNSSDSARPFLLCKCLHINTPTILSYRLFFLIIIKRVSTSCYILSPLLQHRDDEHTSQKQQNSDLEAANWAKKSEQKLNTVKHPEPEEVMELAGKKAVPEVKGELFAEKNMKATKARSIRSQRPRLKSTS